MSISIKEKLAKEQNKKYRTLIKNGDLKIRKEIVSGTTSPQEIIRLFRDYQSNVDKSVTKGIIHRNKAARIKSRIFSLLNQSKNNG